MKLPYRPIIIIPKTKLEKVADWIGISLFLIAIFYIIMQCGNIPNEVPGHFNSKGEVDRWGTKFEILILPVIGAFLFALLSLLEKAPHMHNYPKRINESNVEQFYLTSRKMLNMIKNISLLMFAFLMVQIVRVSLGEINSIGVWFLPVILIIIFGTMTFGIFKQSKIK
ncbi:DUF1648 domain-containing protein [Ureibacillus sp. NPDC094379]